MEALQCSTDLAQSVDLRGCDALTARSRAYRLAHELSPGGSVAFLLNAAPEPLMESLGQQLRHRIGWKASALGQDGWLVELRPRDDVEPDTLMALLGRDHERLDRLFAELLLEANAGKMATAAPMLADYALGLRRHVHVENLVITPVLDLPRDVARRDPLSTMLDDHDRILEELHLLLGFFSEGLPEAWEVTPFMAMLSGTLAKHEGREEQGLFPIWDMRLKSLKDAERKALLDRAKDVLGGGMDEYLEDGNIAFLPC